MSILGELDWFLGIKIVRDRTNKHIYLSQGQYIDNAVHTYKVTTNGRATTPLPVNSEVPINERTATPDQIKAYQRRIGSINFAATQTRPNVAKACFMLSKHLVNPSIEHLAAADHLIRYLHGTKALCLQLEGVGGNVNGNAFHLN